MSSTVRKTVVLIALEGKNKTEKIYLNHYNSRDCKIVICPGSEIDITRMFESLKAVMKKNDYSSEIGDSIYLVADLDNDPHKFAKYEKLLGEATKLGIKVIISNPAFEVWYLLHFEYKTAKIDYAKLLSRLKKYISDYHKALDVHPLVNHLQAQAIKNADKLRGKLNDSDVRIIDVLYTNFDDLVCDLIERNDNFLLTQGKSP